MNYYLDTEFNEDGKTIDLISIGIVAEDGREFYHLNKDCNLRRAMRNEWVRDNVLLPIYKDKVHGDMRNVNLFDRSGMRSVFNGFGMERKSIARAILSFMGFEGADGSIGVPSDPPVIHGYYADYDWVAFCQLFGRMIDLPKGMPMYCQDLKQLMDSWGMGSAWKDAMCPNPADEHNALADARWNMKLHKAILAA